LAREVGHHLVHKGRTSNAESGTSKGTQGTHESEIGSTYCLLEITTCPTSRAQRQKRERSQCECACIRGAHMSKAGTRVLTLSPTARNSLASAKPMPLVLPAPYAYVTERPVTTHS
jgi:hypothetical protein